MKKTAMFRSLLLLAAVALFGGALASQWIHPGLPAAEVKLSAQGTSAPPMIDGTQLMADVNRLKEVVPSQSHTMMDVGFHWSNLWFAAEKKNWPLAQFYFDETRSHILWTIRIRPVRRNPDGTSVDIKAIYDSIDTSAMASVRQAIAQKDSTQFAASYKVMLESCYACHKASAKPYLRPMIPTTPPQGIINYDPDAKWPS